MRAPGRNARRLRAGFAAFLLLTFVAALAPRVAQAATITLTATPGPGQVTLAWVTSSPVPTGFLSTILAHRPVGGSYQYRTPGSNAASGSYTLTGLTNGTTYQFFLTNTWAGHGQVTSNVVTATPIAPGVTVSKSELTITEGGTGVYTVVLNTQPGGAAASRRPTCRVA